MDNIQKIIESGILDLYVLNSVTSEEKIEVERLEATYPQIRMEIELIRSSLEGLIETGNSVPGLTVKPLIFAGIDFRERMRGGENLIETPVLNENSKVSDFDQWLMREDMQLPDDFKDYYIKVLYFSPGIICSLVWIKYEAPYEIHHDQHEKFLILEGSCEIMYDDQVKKFSAGDYFQVPLHVNHRVVITSAIPCKAILQRIAV